MRCEIYEMIVLKDRNGIGCKECAKLSYIKLSNCHLAVLLLKAKLLTYLFDVP